MVTAFHDRRMGAKVIQGRNTDLRLGSQCKSDTDV